VLQVLENRESKQNKSDYSLRHAFAFGSAQLSDVLTYQAFVFWIFTFYFTIVKLDVMLITLAFILWSVWNSLNDPLLGQLSDRTHTKWGRRKPWIVGSLIPLSFVMLLLFYPPKSYGINDVASNFVYFLVIIMIFELFYTAFSLNQTSLFPETFIDNIERAKANNIKQLFSILALFLATLLPSFFIPNLTDSQYIVNWAFFGLTLGILAFAFGLIFIKWGIKERQEFSSDFETQPGLLSSMKLCLRSKSFRWYIPAEVANWYVYGLLPTLVPLYASVVLGITDSLMVSLILGIAFLSAMLFMFIWRVVALKIGPRKTWMLSLSVWALTLIPNMWITTLAEGMLVFFFVGAGLSGSMILIDLIVADIIDEDEVKTGIRREASFYGINALFIRLATIIVFLSISLVFTNVGWTVYAPEDITPEVIFGIRALMFIFPAVALTIGVIALYKYPLDGEYLQEIKAQQKTLHEEKRAKARETAP